MNTDKPTTGFFQKRSDGLSLLIITTHIGFVFLPLYLAVIFGIKWRLLIFSVWFGIGMNGLVNLFHECAHQHVFKKPGASLFLGRWILGPLALVDFDSYQKRHWDHHRWLGEEKDPKYVYRTNIKGFRFILFSVRCLFLMEAFKKISVQTTSPKPSSFWIIRTLLVQIILFFSLFLAGSAAKINPPSLILKNSLGSYFAVYLYGMAAITVLVSSFRAIAEHQIDNDGAMTVKGAALRNFSFGFFSGFLLGAYGFKNHASHHSDPGIPYYRLETKTRQLAAENPIFAPRAAYEEVLLSLIR